MDGIGSLIGLGSELLEGLLGGGGGASGSGSNPLASLLGGLGGSGGGDSIQSSGQQGGGNQTGQIIGDIAQALPLVMAFL